MKTGEHGGNIEKARAFYGLQHTQLIDFSINVNPMGLPKAVKEALLSGIDQLGVYPDPDCTALVRGISKYLEIDTDNIIIGNGAAEIIFLLLAVLRPKKVLIPAPTFSEYAKAVESVGGTVVYHALLEKEDFALDIERLIDASNDGLEAMILCNPNNPTSQLLRQDQLLKLLLYTQQKGITLIIDEAFIELTVQGNQHSMVDKVKAFDHLFIIRAFTKIFAMPGLRLGYGVGNQDILQKMWQRKIPWSVNSLACSLGQVIPHLQDYLNDTRVWLSEEKEWVYEKLKKIRGIKAFKPESCFVLIHILKENLTSIKICETMIRRGFFIRDASNFVFLNEQYIRIAIQDRKNNESMLKALKETLEA